MEKKDNKETKKTTAKKTIPKKETSKKKTTKVATKKEPNKKVPTKVTNKKTVTKEKKAKQSRILNYITFACFSIIAIIYFIEKDAAMALMYLAIAVVFLNLNPYEK